jgi:molecular chaperone DnaJ
MHPDQAYRALGLPWAASKNDVRRAYRRLIRTWHPDRNVHPAAASISAHLNLAYAALTDQEFRPDDKTPAADDTNEASDPSTPAHRSPQRRGARRSRPAFHNLFLTVEQGAQGGVFDFTAQTVDICHACEGFTTIVTEFPCETCAATGRNEDGRVCLDCHGTGCMLMRCTDCQGSGLGKPADFRFKAIIPKGVRGGELYRFRAVGKSSGDARFAAEAIVRVNLAAHPLFSFDAQGRLQVTVPRSRAADELVRIPTLGGPKTLRVPSPAVQEALIRGHGYPEKDGSAGDLIVLFA